MSLLRLLFYVKSGPVSLDVLIATTGGAQESRVVGGTHRISERMAEDLRDGVQLGAFVTSIGQTDDGFVVGYDGRIAARHVIVAAPQPLAGRIRYTQPLPSSRDALLQQIPVGAVIKYNIGYPTPFWRERGLTGFVLSRHHEFIVVLGNSPRDGSCGVLVGFLEGAHTCGAAELTPEQRSEILLDDLVEYFGEQAAEPFDKLEQDWMAEEFTRGCYGGRLGAGCGPSTARHSPITRRVN